MESKIIEKLDSEVLSVVSNSTLEGFQKAYLVAEATGKLQQMLTDAYMAPIMNLQGSKLGFRTDKDKEGGYPMKVVRNCIIEAVLTGLQPVGNQFNIIAGNMYPTKEGFGYLLSKVPNLWYEIIPELPRINQNNTSAAIVMNVSWSLNGSEKKDRQLEIPIRLNKMMGTDAIIGKATRKTRAWLFNTISGCELADGDINDLDSKAYIQNNSQTLPDEEQHNRIQTFINNAESLEELNNIKNSLSKELQEEYALILETRENELIIEEENK